MKNFIWNRFTRFVDAISQAHTFHAHFSLLFTIGAMTFATALSLFFHQITPTGSANIALIYILTIIMISYHTDKYRYGIISGIISVFSLIICLPIHLDSSVFPQQVILYICVSYFIST